jgi:hypothetical protein
MAGVGAVIGVFVAGMGMADQLDKLAASPHFKNALAAAERGDVHRAIAYLIGDGRIESTFDPNHLFGQFADELLRSEEKLVSVHIVALENMH